jgi:hypothetical protein
MRLCITRRSQLCAAQILSIARSDGGDATAVCGIGRSAAAADMAIALLHCIPPLVELSEQVMRGLCFCMIRDLAICRSRCGICCKPLNSRLPGAILQSFCRSACHVTVAPNMLACSLRLFSHFILIFCSLLIPRLSIFSACKPATSLFYIVLANSVPKTFFVTGYTRCLLYLLLLLVSSPISLS